MKGKKQAEMDAYRRFKKLPYGSRVGSREDAAYDHASKALKPKGWE